MDSCEYCGSQFLKTRATRKYCTNRCKTNACLDRKPRRIGAADLQALYELLDRDFESAESLREMLRAILIPGADPLPLVNGRPSVPRLD